MINPYAKGSFTGAYQLRGDIASATPDSTLVVGHAFGVNADGPGIPNEEIAGFIDDNFAAFPIAPNQDVARALQTKPAYIINGDPTNTYGEGLSTTGELEAAERYMALNGLSKVILVGQAYHAGRIGRQADALHAKSGMLDFEVIMVAGYPTAFDPRSEQWWIRSRRQWIMREILAAPKLKFIDGQLL